MLELEEKKEKRYDMGINDMDVEFDYIPVKAVKDESIESIKEDNEINQKRILKQIIVDDIHTKAVETKKNKYEEEEAKYLKAAKEAAKASK